MATNDFLVFGGGAGANVITQAAWAALTARTAGFSSGVAQSAQLNKAWRQASIMAAVLAQFISDRTGQDVLDDGTTTTLLANLKAAAAAVNGDATKTFSVAAATANQHALNLGQFLASLAANGYVKIPTTAGTLIVQWAFVNGATTSGLTVSLPISFVSTFYAAYVTHAVAKGATAYTVGATPNGLSAVDVTPTTATINGYVLCIGK